MLASVKAYNEAFGVFAEKEAAYKDAKTSWINNYVTTNIAETADDQRGKLSSLLGAYEELNHKNNGELIGNYGWTKRELLYAIQDSVINPSANSISDVRTPNVTGNNITLTTENGNFGKVNPEITKIAISEMYDEGKTTDAQLKELAKARAEDVTWTDDQITIQRTTPISVKVNSKADGTYGNVTIKAPNAEHVYLLAKDSPLNIDDVIAKGDVRLLAQKGIQGIKGSATIIGDKITLEGGYGDLGSAQHALQIGLLNGSKLNATSAGNMYINQLLDNTKVPAGAELNQDFVMGGLAANNIYITTTDRNVVSGNDKITSNDPTQVVNISYINAKGSLNIDTKGDVGQELNGLRVKNSGGKVNLNANNAYLEAKQNGELVLNAVDVQNQFDVTSEGSLLIGREDDNTVAKVEADKMFFSTDRDVIFSGKLQGRNEASDMIISSLGGNVKQTSTNEEENIEIGKLTLSVLQGNVSLDNEHNRIGELLVAGLGKDLSVTVDQDKLAVKLDELTNNYGGDVSIKNVSGDILVEKDSVANIKGSLELNAEKNVTHEGNTTTQKDLTIITNNGDVLFTEGSVATAAGDGTIKVSTNNGKITSVEGSIIQAGSEEAVNGNLDIHSVTGDIDLFEIFAGDKIRVESDNSNVTLHNVNGNVVALVTKNPDAKLRAENIIVGDRLSVTSNDVLIESILQRQGKDSVLEVETNGSIPGEPMHNIEMHFGDMENGVNFEELWTNTGNITVASGSLNFEKMHINDLLNINSSGMSTKVYGSIPQIDNTDAIYWNHPDKWITLYIDKNGTTQYSDGTLLHLNDYRYVYDQRFPGENYLQHRLSLHAIDSYNDIYLPEVVLYDRYDLWYDVDDKEEEKAEILVENI